MADSPLLRLPNVTPTIGLPTPAPVPAPAGFLPPPVVPGSLRTSPAGLSDRTLGSRLFMNPNVGVREPIAVGSVYRTANVPDYLTSAVDSLNRTQLKRATDQEAYRQSLLGMATGPNAYLVAPALAAAAVAPGRSVTLGGDGLFENPLIAEAENKAKTAAANTSAVITNDIAARQRKIADMKQQLGTLWGPASNVKRGDLTIRLGNEERDLRELQNTAMAKGVAGWVGNQAK